VNIQVMDEVLRQIFAKPVPEYGNDEACKNCGDEWSELVDGYCPECDAIR
jgi:hypothetical protein